MTDTIQNYHRHTEYDRLNMRGHALDWSNQPSVYKDYSGLSRVALPEIALLPDKTFCDLLKPASAISGARTPTDQDLSCMLFLGFGITGRRRTIGDDFYYRSVPSAGALYPCELYVATQSIPGLQDGLYHYAIHHREMVRLRDGVHTDRSGSHKAGDSFFTVMTFYITTIFYRSIWKYRDRAYRYHLLDTGHLVESLMLAAKSLDLPCQVTFDFDDAAVNSLLGIDGGREACLAIINFPGRISADNPGTGPIESLFHADASRVSPREEIPAAIQRIHQAASCVVDARNGECDMLMECGAQPHAWQPMYFFEATFPELMSFSQVVITRRSRRNFVSRALNRHQFQALMQTIWMPDSGQFQPFQFVASGVIVGSGQDIESGIYWINPHVHAVGIIQPGLFSTEMARIALNQQWMESASLQFFFVAPLSAIERLWGPRAYRYTMISAGRLAHRIYLGSTALGLGCCGVGAFYDQEASSLLGLNHLSALLYMVAAGPIKHQLT